MGCGCAKVTTSSIQQVLAADSSQAAPLHRGVTEEQHNSSPTQVDSVARFTRKSEFEDFFERSALRPHRNKDMSDAYAHSEMNLLEAHGRPKTTLQMEYIYGYRCFLSKQNLYYTLRGENVAYPAAAVVVLLNKSSNTQTFLGGGELVSSQGHSDIIVTLAINSRRDLLASGEIGSNPLICIWKLDSGTTSEQKRIEQGSGTRAVSALCFSCDSRYLLAADQSDKQQIRIYDWKESAALTHTLAGGAGRIWNLACSSEHGVFCAVGKGQFAFWSLKGQEYVKHRPKDYDESIRMNVVQWMSTGNCITGGSDGKLYLWIDKKLRKSFQILDSGCEVNALTVVADVLLIGGESNTVFMLNATFKEMARFQVPDWVISLDKYEDYILCGTRNGLIQELSGHHRNVLMESHCEREVWSMALSNTEWNVLISAGDDNKIKMWDLSQRRCATTCILEALPPTTRVHRTSLLPMNHQSRALCISPKGHVAVAHNDGRVTVRNNVHQLNLIIKVLNDAMDWIQSMRYSPKGSSLAIGSHDHHVYVYDVSSNYTLFHTLAAHLAGVVSIDWSLDESLIKTCATSGQLLIWDVQSETQVKEPQGEAWATWTSPTGVCVQGINQMVGECDFITCVSRSEDGRKVAVGNSWGLLEVYDCPNMYGAKANVYRGHSQEVANAVWTHKDRLLLTAGGPDLSIIQWRVVEGNRT